MIPIKRQRCFVEYLKGIFFPLLLAQCYRVEYFPREFLSDPFLRCISGLQTSFLNEAGTCFLSPCFSP